MAEGQLTMSGQEDQQLNSIGYGRPPKATRFRQGQSGNPKGRPRSKRREVPYDFLLGQMVTVREDGRERRITAAEAFLLQLTRRGLAGDSAASRASLLAIENARGAHKERTEKTRTVSIQWRTFGLCGTLEDLGTAVRLHPESKDQVRLMLKPWIVEAALARLGDRQLSPREQEVVIASTRTPAKVQWPTWWSVRPWTSA